MHLLVVKLTELTLEVNTDSCNFVHCLHGSNLFFLPFLFLEFGCYVERVWFFSCSCLLSSTFIKFILS